MEVIGSIIALLLLLYTVNFLGNFSQIGFVILSIACIGTLSKRYIKKSWQDLFVFTFLLSYFFVADMMMGENMYAKIIQYAALYLFGVFICEYCLNNNNRELLFKIIFWGTVGFGLYGVLCTFKNGIIMRSDQRIGDFWDNSSVISSTQISAWIVTFIAIIPWVVLQFKETKKTYKAIIVVLGTLSVISIFILASRTSLLVIVAAVILTLYCLFKEDQRKVLIRIVFLLCIIYFAYRMNFAGIQDKLIGSNLIVRLIKKSESGGVFQTSRTTRWLYFLSHWSECLTGNYYFSNRIGAQVHSALFDLYDQAGMLPFILLLLIVSRVIYTLFQIRKRDDNIVFIRGFQIWFLLMSFVLFTEPVWYYGRAQYIAFVFFMLGIFEHYWLWARGKVIGKDE